jgi:hypothetical protein
MMAQPALTLSLGKSTEEVTNEGYRAQCDGKDMVRNNPYPPDCNNHWLWRKGFIDAFQDSN